MELTLEQLFGAKASQNSQTLIISKKDLFGLTPNINNRAEQLLVAIVINALGVMSGTLTEESNFVLSDENNIPLAFDNSQLFTELSIFEWDVKFLFRQESSYIQNTIVILQYEMV